MSSRYREEGRVQQGSEYAYDRRSLTSTEVQQLQGLLSILRGQEQTYPKLAADQNDFQLSRSVVHRFTTDASRTITGFVNANIGVQVIVNVGAQNLVLANDSASSTEQNRILCHTGANITLNPNESALIFYDRTSARVRTVGFV